jgi:hypothetical protein
MCHYSGIAGHFKVYCRKKKREDAARGNEAILLTATSGDLSYCVERTYNKVYGC